MDTLNIVTLSQAIANSDAFVDVMANIQFETRLITADAFLKGLAPSAGLLVFLFDEASFNDDMIRQKLAEHIQRQPSVLHVCILTAGCDVLASDLCTLIDDFLVWPCYSTELEARIRRANGQVKRTSVSPLEQQLLEEFSQANLVGRSQVFVRSLQLIKKIAKTEAPVLIQGETGTGKENAARAIHYLGERRECAFVPINCGAIPDELFESEFFGYEKGAFTDAKASQLGLVEVARGGTLFLDEVDSLSPKAQAALLRFLQTQEFRPLGGKQTRQANVRVLAATNADLNRRVAKDLFREDLLFRLNVLALVMPPLRDRRDDIPCIAKSLLHKFSLDYGLDYKQLTHHSVQWLLQQPWPGNVRELENLLLREFLLSEGDMIYLDEAEHSTGDAGKNDEFAPTFEGTLDLNKEPIRLGEFPDSDLSFQEAKTAIINRFEKAYVKNALKLADGNISEAARISGKERRAFGKLVKKYKIDKRVFQQLA